MTQPNIIEMLETQVYPALGLERIYKGCTFKTRDDERWRGAGPFRESESGTSFVVTPQSLLWWDEGLRAGGGPLQFRHRLDGGNGTVRGQDFVAVARQLFAEAGVAFPERNLSEAESVRLLERERRAFVVETLGKECAAILWTTAGEVAREYLRERGLSDEGMKQLGIGLYHDHEELRDTLCNAGVDLPEIRRNGTGQKHDLAWSSLKQLEGYITFPWLDAQSRGQTVYGRWPGSPPGDKPKTWALSGDGSKRSPFCLNRAKAAGVKHVRLVEGVLDAAVAQSSGDLSVIACVAASLSKDQGWALARCGIEAVTVCLDPDSAGENGTLSCLHTLEQYPIDVYVAAKLPDGLDPDEFIIKNGIEAWHRHCEQAEHAYRRVAADMVRLPEGERWTDPCVQQAWRRAEVFARSVKASHRQADLHKFFWPTILRELGITDVPLADQSVIGANHPVAAVDDDWPAPSVLESELPDVEPFHEDLLPESFRPLVVDITERMQVPMDYPAVTLVLCAAGAVNRRAVIQPKANDTSWVVVPNLWGGIIAPPGYLKSPVLHAATRPLYQIQAEWLEEYKAAQLEYASAAEEWELRKAAWKDLCKQQFKKGGVAPERPDAAPDKPKLRRLIMNDATFEAMHETMSENPAGILVIRDELTGWWSQLDRPGREGERAFCLQAWNGDTGHTIDRIGRGTIHVPACCVSMLGGIQPGRLRSYLIDALQDGPSNDGLIQRFQLLVWPDTKPDWKYIDRLPNQQAEHQVVTAMRLLVELDAENPLRFRFAPDAQVFFVEWLADLESKVRGTDLPPALISHLSKYRGLMPTLSLLFELLDRAAGGFVGFEGSFRGQTANIYVSLDHAQQAAAWCGYLESHAKRVYSCTVTPHTRAAQELANKIKLRKIGADGCFTCREIYLKGWSGLETPEAAKAAANVLQDAGWLRAMLADPGPAGGRPSNSYQVNPRVWR